MSDPMTDLTLECLADADRELREARRENAELRAENARLRATVCQAPQSEECARRWQSDLHQLQLEQLGLAEDYGQFGCDVVEWMGPDLLHARRRVAELEDEVARLQRQVQGHCDRIAAQSELLSRRAESCVTCARLRDLLWRCHVAFLAHHTRHHVLAMHAAGHVCPVCEASGLLAEIDRESGEGAGDDGAGVECQQ